MFARNRMVKHRKNTRKQRKQNKQRKQSHRQRQRQSQRQRQRQSQRQRQRQRQDGGAAVFEGAPTSYNLSQTTGTQSLKQGEEFMNLTKQYHGGSAPLSSMGLPLLDGPGAAAAGTAVLDRAIADVAPLKDLQGGRRRSSRKHRKASRKQRKANHKHRKASRKQHKSSRKSHKSHKSRKNYRQRQGGGGCLADAAAPYTKDVADGMLLKDYSGAGLHAEWKDVTGAGGGDYLGPNKA